MTGPLAVLCLLTILAVVVFILVTDELQRRELRKRHASTMEFWSEDAVNRRVDASVAKFNHAIWEKHRPAIEATGFTYDQWMDPVGHLRSRTAYYDPESPIGVRFEPGAGD